MNLELFILFLIRTVIVNAVPSQQQQLQQNNTLQLCCPPEQYFNMTHYKCEPLPRGVDLSWNLKINYSNETKKEVNVLRNFIYKVNIPCEKPEALYWQVNESVDIGITTSTEHCVTPFYLKDSRKYAIVLLDCRLELNYFLAFRHEYIYLFSEILLVPTLIVYIILKPLHEKLMGKCFICYLGSVIIGNVFYFIIPQMLLIKYNLPNMVYILIAHVHFYFNMAIVFWINVLGCDVWNYFRESHEEMSELEKKRQFRFYSIYAWSLAALTTAPTIWRNFSGIYDHCNKYEQSKSCVSLTYGVLYTDIYFEPAVVTILIFNFLIFCCVSWKVYKIRSRRAEITNERLKIFKENTAICLRLFILMGPQWILIYWLKNYDFIEILIISMNYIDSLLIFILFVLKKNVLQLLIAKFNFSKI